MKRKVINKKIKDYNYKYKLISILSALTISLSNVPVFANNMTINNDSISYETINTNSVLQDIYQEQMEYLVPVIEKLKKFYKEKDTKDIIKNGYGSAHNVINANLNYNAIYNGTDYNYISNTKDLMSEIERLNILISNLKIKALGNGRDPEYGIIKDESSEFGFRIKTEEDNKLIDEYTEIVGNRYIVDNNIINLINGINNNLNIEDTLLKSLESTYNRQIKYIHETRNKLKDFYEKIDVDDIIKTSYINTYNSYNENLNYVVVGESIGMFKNEEILMDESLSTKDKIDKYIELIKKNNLIISNLKIKALGNGRDPEYGIIKDENSELGFRLKTEEDKKLIDEYTNLIGKSEVISDSFIKLFEDANEYNLNNIKKLSKSYSN